VHGHLSTLPERTPRSRGKTSLKSTEDGQVHELPINTTQADPDGSLVPLPASIANEVTTKDEQIAELQDKLADMADGRCEDRFWLGAIIVALLDCLILPSQPFLVMAVILFLEISAGVHFAKKMGLEKIVVLLDRAKELFSDHFRPKK